MKSGALRDILILIAAFAIVLGGLYLYTGTWPPAVIVESGSMMHADPEVTYGRIGTIDPGDLVLVKHVASVDDVKTLVEGGPTHYGKPGDVIVYYSGNLRTATPIIHRAVAYVEVLGPSASPTGYRVRWDPNAPCEGGANKTATEANWCVYDAKGIYIPSVPVQQFGSTPENPKYYKPAQTGFLTKGDNPATNPQTDQLSGLSHDASGRPSTVQLDWIEGKARGELPWLGLIKLSLAGRPNEASPPPTWVKVGSAYAPKDLWVCLGVSLFVVVGVPLIYDGYKAVQSRRARRAGPVESPKGVAATGDGPASVKISWDADPKASVYKVYRGEDMIARTPGTWHVDHERLPGVTYYYAVSAVDELGNESPKSHPVSATTTP